MSMTTQSIVEMPSLGASEAIAEFRTYPEAQHLVDRLADAKFPVEHVRIVGSGIQSVEQVTGRLTLGRATVLGLGGGAWFGLLVGLLLSVFSVGPAWFALVLTGVGFGALWGAAFGAIVQAVSDGRRDFTSVKALVAERYRVEVDPGFAPEALRLSGVPA